MEFAMELKKLLDAEESPPLDPLVELARAQAEMLETLHRSGSDISLQVEEIYDIVKQSDDNVKELKNAAKREGLLLGSLVAINDLLDGLVQHAQFTGSDHTNTIYAKRAEALGACGVERVGQPGQLLDPRIHTVASAEISPEPFESVLQVLESGYAYNGSILRKATVIISKGSEE